MWEFLGSHPGWGLGYLVVVCFSVTLVVSLATSGGVSRRTTRLRSPSKEKTDVVH